MGDPAGTNPGANGGAAIENLVERFERNIDSYRQGNYNETLVRRDFIDPMFAALGWDIDNRAGGRSMKFSSEEFNRISLAWQVLLRFS